MRLFIIALCAMAQVAILVSIANDTRDMKRAFLSIAQAVVDLNHSKAPSKEDQ